MSIYSVDFQQMAFLFYLDSVRRILIDIIFEIKLCFSDLKTASILSQITGLAQLRIITKFRIRLGIFFQKLGL